MELWLVPQFTRRRICKIRTETIFWSNHTGHCYLILNWIISIPSSLEGMQIGELPWGLPSFHLWDGIEKTQAHEVKMTQVSRATAMAKPGLHRGLPNPCVRWESQPESLLFFLVKCCLPFVHVQSHIKGNAFSALGKRTEVRMWRIRHLTTHSWLGLPIWWVSLQSVLNLNQIYWDRIYRSEVY